MDASTSHSGMNDALRPCLGVSEALLAGFCRRWKITELAVFGSLLRGDFRPDSDVDLDIVWKAATQEAPAFLNQIKSLLSDAPE